MKRSELTDEQMGAKLCKAYDAMAALHAAGVAETHPRHVLNDWQRQIRVARDASSAEIERKDVARDNPPHTSGTPAAPAQDSMGGRVEIEGYARLSNGMSGSRDTREFEADGITVRMPGGRR